MKKIFVTGFCVFIVLCTIIFTKAANDVVKKVSERHLIIEGLNN